MLHDLTHLVLCELCARWAEGIDFNLEHYRWSAFAQFLWTNSILTSTQFDCLWDLGTSDPDQAMGRAMLFELISQPDCPGTLLERAASSQHTALARKSQHLLARRFANTPAR
ncbi:hypothetical protein [Deinococcus marmoris]|uniref:hypothetical protein n=1 Tax=Deinococcus marmoris TaxID=249408 RepID=UPI000497FE60|nr:hypothetical protein [Deinococcus marmoris]